MAIDVSDLPVEKLIEHAEIRMVFADQAEERGRHDAARLEARFGGNYYMAVAHRYSAASAKRAGEFARLAELAYKRGKTPVRARQARHFAESLEEYVAKQEAYNRDFFANLEAH